MELAETCVALVAICILKRRNVRKDWVMRATILGFNVLVNAYFFLDPLNPIIHLQYIFVVAFSHIQRLNSFFFVMWISLCSTATYLNIRISAMHNKFRGEDKGGYSWLQVEWLFVAVLLNTLLWTY